MSNNYDNITAERLRLIAENMALVRFDLTMGKISRNFAMDRLKALRDAYLSLKKEVQYEI